MQENGVEYVELTFINTARIHRTTDMCQRDWHGNPDVWCVPFQLAEHE